ncbi:MAG: hypothetical protein V1743_04735 [Nanoarchaeota archaeon]
MVDFTANFQELERLRRLKELKKKEENELKDLIRKKETELEKTDVEIRQNIEQIAQKEKRRTEEQERHDAEELAKLKAQRAGLQKELEELAAAGSLEERLAKERLRSPEEAGKNIIYLTDELKGEEANIYKLTNYNVYGQLAEIRNKAAGGEYITSQEREFMESVRKKAERYVSDEDYLTQKDPFDYVHRAEDILGQIDNYVRLRKKHE